MKLQNKAIVVTGASSGMGKAIVERFVKEGAFVVAVARRRERLEALAESLSGEAGRIVPYVGDVSKAEDCEGMIDTCVKEFGKLDVLVNNAGVMDDMSTVASATDEKYDYVMGINVYGPFAAMRKAVNVFLAQGNGGNIITVSSVGAQHQVCLRRFQGSCQRALPPHRLHLPQRKNPLQRHRSRRYQNRNLHFHGNAQYRRIRTDSGSSGSHARHG